MTDIVERLRDIQEDLPDARWRDVVGFAIHELEKSQKQLVKWQPIETSPRDGKPFLGYLGGLKVPHFVCWWSTSIKTGEPYICILGIGELWDHKLFPTHWMPLPEFTLTGETGT